MMTERLLVLAHLVCLARAMECPCDDASLCKSVTEKREKEFFGFGVPLGNWNSVTTVAWADTLKTPSYVCQAHKAGVRLIRHSPTVLFSSSQVERSKWIDSLLSLLQEGFYDGVTFDYESPMDSTPGSSTYEQQRQYVMLINETTMRVHEAIPGSQVSVCAAWSPDNIDGRNYDYSALAAASDLLYVMGYDTRSQIYDRCIASANAPASTLIRGIERYIQLGIPASKLVMGTPWYGYIYACENATPTDDVCQLKLVPFRGVNCSDAAGFESSFMHIMDLYDRGTCPGGLTSPCRVTTELRVDSSTQSPYFNFVDGNSNVHQVWFDDARSSAIKYRAGAALGVRGVGPYTWDDLDNDGSITGNPKAAAEAASMWAAFSAFHDTNGRDLLV